ncbi:glycosyltransferase family 2 protein [Aequorivita sinensis]|uniref:glycosyltransferase family 2 protein n=1 Tax=Aequorivita sinensis TaxID=1382458 RepID=UPI0023017717|nr:glycosyltransferase [Aequorivita sinensis]
MKISVIIPVYNASKFLDKCINSLLQAQIEEVANEIILVDDGSTDNSLQICEMYANSHKNIKVYSQENQGPSVARNLGIEKALGNYITFVDSDDYVEKDYLKEIYSVISTYPSVDIFVFGYFKVENNIKTEFFSFSKFNEIIENKGIKKLLLNTVEYNFLLFPVNKIYRKSLIMNSGLFPTNLRLGEDPIFNLKQFYNASNLVFINKSIYNYFYNINSVTSKKYKPNLINQMSDHFKTKLKFYESKPDLNNKFYFRDIARVNLEKTFYSFLQNILANPDSNFINELKNIRELELIKFGFKYGQLKDLSNMKQRLTLWLFKHRRYKILKLIYLKSLW